MQFSLQSLMLSFVVVASSLATFGLWGLAVAIVLLAITAYIRRAESMKKSTMKVSVVFLCMLAFYVFWEGIVDPIELSRCSGCRFNLKEISLALHRYAEDHGSLPPAYVDGPDGKPWHSWRVLILPYLDEADLYKKYNFKEPWNGPNNSKLALSIPYVYICPSDQRLNNINATNYLAVVGQETVWPENHSVKLNDITNDKDKTILLVETPNSGINWMEPRDLDLEKICRSKKPNTSSGLFASHIYNAGHFYKLQDRANIAFVDGSVNKLSKEFLLKNIKALCSRSGGNVVNYDFIVQPELDWSFIFSLIALFLSAIILTFRPRQCEVQTAETP